MSQTLITINPRLKNLIRPLSELEFSQLEANVLRDGCREPLTVWEHDGDNILLDGHNRYAICTKHGLPYTTASVKSVAVDGSTVPIDSFERAEIWVGINQNGRRNLDANDRAVLAAQLVPAFAVEAARRVGGRPRKEEKPAPVAQKGDKNLLKELSKISDTQAAHTPKPAPVLVPQPTLKEVSRNNNLAAAQAAQVVGANRTYVVAVAKAAGYDNKTQTFKKPEAFSAIGTGLGQTPIADLRKQQNQANRAAKIAEITTENATKLPEEREYTVLYIDPPWQYRHVISDSRKVENHYPTMTDEALQKFQVVFANGVSKPIGDIAAENSVLFLWTTAPRTDSAIDLIRAWGFKYVTHAVWDKEKIGMGYWFRGQHEVLMVATKGQPSVPDVGARVSSVIHAPRGRHSEKPEVVYEIIERMFPGAARVEVFARNEREGWDSVGNQLEAQATEDAALPIAA